MNWKGLVHYVTEYKRLGLYDLVELVSMIG
jgi:hypothetical protein